MFASGSTSADSNSTLLYVEEARLLFFPLRRGCGWVRSIKSGSNRGTTYRIPAAEYAGHYHPEPTIMINSEKNAAAGFESKRGKRLMDRREMVKLSLAALAVGRAVDALAMPQTALDDKRSANQKMRFGLNYVPRRNWWYVWEDWDAKSVGEDLQAIADLGMDHIRVQCLWPYFQPGINYVSPVALKRLRELLDEAGKVKLDVEVTVLNGWLSGYFFLPPWLAPCASDSNAFVSPAAIEAQELLFQSITDAIGNHEYFLGFDLGNEINSLQHSEGNRTTLTQADQWASRMLATTERLVPGKLHVNGVDHQPWFGDCGFSRHCLSGTGSVTTMHCYAYWTGALKRYRYDDTGNLHLLEYMIELAKAYQDDPNRQVWVEEVGTSKEWMPDDYIPEYLNRLLTNAASCGNVWGFTWWCSHDIDPSMKGFQSLEYSLGVLDSNNRVKPAGKAFAKLAQEMRENPPSPLARQVALVISDQEFSQPGDSGGWSIAEQYLKLIADGVRPRILLASRLDDKTYQQRMGIKELIYAKCT